MRSLAIFRDRIDACLAGANSFMEPKFLHPVMDFERFADRSRFFRKTSRILMPRERKEISAINNVQFSELDRLTLTDDLRSVAHKKRRNATHVRIDGNL